MSKLPLILFCESPLEPGKVDEDFADQFEAARQNGFSCLLFNYEDLTSADRFSRATKRIKSSEDSELIVYRGWMLTPAQYAILFNDLLSKNYRLINTVGEYQHCHYLPDSLRYIGEKTPKTVFESLSAESAIDRFIEKVKEFGHNPIILKDYVKSEKHDWDTACFVENASDSARLRQTIDNFLRLRGKHLNEGLVAREFIKLNHLTTHSKSGMPLTEEYRLFFCNKKLLGVYDYWEEGEYSPSKPITTEFEEIAKNIESNFFSMDIARKENGEVIIIELGDGQVAGLPDKTDRNEFYGELRRCFN